MLFVPCPVSSEGEAYSFIYLSVRGIEPRVSLESVWQMVTTEPHLRPKRWSPPFHCENWGINCVCGHLCHLPVSLCSLGSPPPPSHLPFLVMPSVFPTSLPLRLLFCLSVCHVVPSACDLPVPSSFPDVHSGSSQCFSLLAIVAET